MVEEDTRLLSHKGEGDGFAGIDGPIVFQEIDFGRMEIHRVRIFIRAGLVSVNLIVSPSVTRTTGPGTVPLKVQAAYSLLSFNDESVSTAVMATSWVLAQVGDDRTRLPARKPVSRAKAPNSSLLHASLLLLL